MLNYRKIPQDEIDAVTMTMDAVYTCKIASLPPTMLAHPFWYSFGHGASILFKSCLGPEVYRRVKDFQSIFQMCGPRFGHSNMPPKAVDVDRHTDTVRGRADANRRAAARKKISRHRLSMEMCKELFYNHGSWEINTAITRANSTFSTLITRYKHFLKELTPKLRSCAAKTFDKVCSVSKTRVVKTVRALGVHALPLLEKYPDLKLIHLLRDPRAVAVSRAANTWSQGMWEGHGFTKLAQGYCNASIRDIQTLASFTGSHPSHTTYRISFEQLMDNVIRATTDMLRFVGTVPTGKQLESLKKGEVKISHRDRWREKISGAEQTTILQLCKELYDLYKSEWHSVLLPTRSKLLSGPRRGYKGKVPAVKTAIGKDRRLNKDAGPPARQPSGKQILTARGTWLHM